MNNEKKNIVLDDNERWVEEGEGKYSITSDGKVYSYITGKKEELKQSVIAGRGSSKGYKVVNLYLGWGRVMYVHKLIAEAFLENKNNDKLVMYKDRDTFNNHVDNLFWYTKIDRRSDRRKELLSLDKEQLTKDAIYKRFEKEAIDLYLPSTLEECGIPPEILSVRIVKKNLRETWDYYSLMFYLFEDDDRTCKEISEKLGVSSTTVSKVRRGISAKGVREIYEKYKKDAKYIPF